MDKGNITGLLTATAGGRRTQMDKAQIKAAYGGWDGQLEVGMRFVERAAIFIEKNRAGEYYKLSSQPDDKSLTYVEVIAVDRAEGTIRFRQDDFIYGVRKNSRRYATWESREVKSYLRKDGLVRTNNFKHPQAGWTWVPYGDFYYNYVPLPAIPFAGREYIEKFIRQEENKKRK